MVFGLGLKASASDTLYLFRRPGKLVRAFLAMDVVVPLVAIALAVTLPLEPPVKIALVTLSLAPLPPTFSKKPLKAGGTVSYTVGLFVAFTIIAVGFIPLALYLLNRLTGIALQMSPAAIWTLVLWSLLVPLVAGVFIHQIAPAVAGRAAEPVANVGSIVLLIAVIPILIRVWPVMLSLIGNGHVLGGPDPAERATLAFSSAARHPAIAIAIANANFPDQKLAPAAVLLYLVVSGIVGAPYLRWVGRQQTSVAVA